MPPEPKLQGIVYDSARPLAIVNGKSLSVGDTMADFRVKQISADSVTLTGADGSEKILRLEK